jgi:methylated-DNA-[protein]-cysteine S-methyltransferase
MSAFYTLFRSPLGILRLTSDGRFLTGIEFPQRQQVQHPVFRGTETMAPFGEICQQLSEYFDGTRREFLIPIRMEGTEFQKKVWKALTTIPYGSTVSYGQLATMIGNPKACRAVGLANGRNRVPIIIPCHRVIGSNGTLTGFGGGLPNKQWLLDWEQTSLAQHKDVPSLLPSRRANPFFVN